MSRREVERIFAAWQRRLRLDAWEVELGFGEVEDGSHAEVSVNGDYERARIDLSPAWRTWTREHANRVAAHELVHLVAHDLDWCSGGELLGEHLRPDVHAAVRAVHGHHLERVVERLACVLVREVGLA